eukprot:TRINITY_DN9431_c0_g2_i2.p1 TRINITY_DN9431_c0_g2~~TRINITY_DN9431_c0_g2_i2.p1  ORF type:complete len:1044 (+),score=348.59 TRINITY_DN9431_c0_g2_i2:364-3132(+)
MEKSNGYKTVPIIFIDSQFIGGCNDVVSLETSGDLYPKLGVSAPPTSIAWNTREQVRRKPMSSGLFYFPHTVNAYPVRLIALQMVAICVVCIIWREKTWAAWLALGMALDFLVRFVGGAAFSPAGALAMLASVPFKEDLRNGPPKQFATGIGLAFSVAGGLCLMNGEDIAGAVILGGLSGPAFLEAAFDFCLGCWFFGIMTKVGIVRADVYQVHIDQKPYVQRTLELIDDFSSKLKTVEMLQYREPGQPKTPADVTLKRFKGDDHQRRAFNPVRYVMIADMMMPLGIAGLALAWKKPACRDCVYTDYLPTESYSGSDLIWKVIAYISLALFSLIGLLLVAKLVRFPHKVYSEVVHPIKSNAVTALPMLICVYSILLQPDGSEMADFQKALFWIGASLLKVMLIWKCAWLVGNRGDPALTSPTLLLPIGGGLVASMNAAMFTGYGEIAWFLFSLPALLSILLFGGTFLAAIPFHWSDERMRSSVGMWSTVLHLIMMAFRALPKSPMNAPGSTNVIADVAAFDSFSKMLFWAGVTLALVFMWLAVPMGFIFRIKFDFSYWSVAFTADILAAACVMYVYSINPNDDLHLWGEYAAAAALVTATWVNVVLFLNTLFWLAKRRWLRPMYKFGPLSFNKLSHEALRESGSHLLRTAESIVDAAGDDNLKARDLAKGLVAHLKMHLMVLDWHSHMEDTQLFRMVDSFHPMVTRDGYRQHAALHTMEHQASDLLQRLEAGGKDYSKTVKELRDLLRDFVPFSDEHMDWEEDNLNGLLRKGFNAMIQKKLLVNIWDAYMSKSMEEVRGKVAETPTEWSMYDFTKLREEQNPFKGENNRDSIMAFPPQFPPEEMPLQKQQILRVALPFILFWLPMPIQKTRFARTLAWAVPEHAQQVGEMFYRGIPDTMWAVLATDVPEIIPRGLPGWVRRV